ncbi:MAG: hypothetical protein LBL39_00850 [Planctomycetaceae bacterium]|jgi:hypothetical protein|nr:hypothetical protein [Planctomycetaceae bacterium]
MLKPFLKFEKLDTQAQQRGAVVQGRSLSPYRLRYSYFGVVCRWLCLVSTLLEFVPDINVLCIN